MKMLPPPSPQMQLPICQNRALASIAPDARREAVRALAEILLVASEALDRAKEMEGGDDAP